FPHVAVLRPGLAARFTRRRHGVPAPDFLARARVQRLDAAADATLTTRMTNDDHAVVVHRCHGDGIAAIAQPLALRAPRPLAALLIECDSFVAELAHVDAAIA